MVGFSDLAQSVLQTGGVAALVAAAVVYLLKKVLEKKLDARFANASEKLKAELASQNLYIQEIIQRQTERYPPLAESVYRSRNVSRQLMNELPQLNAQQRSELGDLTLRITEHLYETRIFLPRSLFDSLHAYKTHLQNFIFDYDIVTAGSKPSPINVLIKSLSTEFLEIDKMHQNIISDLQNILKIDGPRAVDPNTLERMR
jgi:hypothetical protein